MNKDNKANKKCVQNIWKERLRNMDECALAKLEKLCLMFKLNQQARKFAKLKEDKRQR